MVETKNENFEVEFVRTRATDDLKNVQKLWAEDGVDGHVTLIIHWNFDNFDYINHGNRQKLEPANPLLLAPAADSPKNVLNALNDDGIRYILEMCLKKDPMVVCELARACKRFQYIVQEIVKTKYKSALFVLWNWLEAVAVSRGFLLNVWSMDN